ncbi:hypothetical protein BT93_D1525 [Corymbia citriodora subsp. variegata]|nr:hypothetical protein BT93_D1525 [Corymbia citriodora subsp. variegata]
MASRFLMSLFAMLFLSAALALNTSISSSSSSSSTSLPTYHLSSIRFFCSSRPYPDTCFDSLKISISINISPTILTYLLHTLEAAISDAGKLSNILQTAGHGNIVERQRGTIQDCRELHQITVSSLKRSVSRVQDGDPQKLSDARAYLAAALTNKDTCLEGLDSASGSLKPLLVRSLISTYRQVSNSLSMVANPATPQGGRGRRRRLMGFPAWLSHKDRRILQSSGDEYDPSEVITVSADGSGNFTTISDAINFAPNNSDDRTIIYVTEGLYQENLEIPSYKTNMVLLGDGADVTIISGNRSVADGWTTFRSATVAVSADGFLARDITFENSAGPEKHQAVALRISADFAALYRCSINAYQDTLYVHSFRQFYRECDISGTIDYIFGNAAVVFQGCNIISRQPLPDQVTVVTAQSRVTPDQDTGISIQNCTILPADDLSAAVKSYLGRPWRNYSRTVVLESYIDGFIDPRGWTEWSGDQGLDTLYYGEYENYGPGSATDGRVTWLGYHIMDYYDASNFTVSDFITGDEWLDSTAFPYEDSI